MITIKLTNSEYNTMMEALQLYCRKHDSIIKNDNSGDLERKLSKGSKERAHRLLKKILLKKIEK